MHGVAPYPLYWPLQHPRAKYRREARFLVDFSTARYVVISSNVPLRRDGLLSSPDREPQDPGVAVYFSRRTSGGGEKPYIIACDQFTRIRWNLRAIGATIEALRSIERHGTTSMLEQAFSGFAALPPAPSADKSWREILGLDPAARVDADTVRATYRELARLHHPDVGGSSERMTELNVAVAAALRELGAT